MRISLETPTSPVLLAEGGKAPSRFLLLNEGETPWKGITLDRETAERVIADFNEHGIKIPIDYHHATERVDPTKGGKAPAAGHIGQLEYVEGEGLFATDVEWTAEGKKDVESRAFIYTSPAILADEDGNIVRMTSVALTNQPRTVDARELLKAADMLMEAATTRKDSRMTEKDRKLVADVLKPLRIEIATDHDVDGDDLPAVDAVQKAMSDLIEVLKEKGAPIESDASMLTVITAAVEALGGEPEEETTEEEVVEEVAETKETKTAERGSAVDRVKLAQYETLNKQVKDLVAKLAERDAADKAAHVETLLAEQVEANKLNPNNEEAMSSARKLAANDPESFTALFAEIASYAPAGATMSSGTTGTGVAGSRKRLIADARAEYETGGSSMQIVCPKLATFVNQGLRENKLTMLTEDELKSFV